MKNPSKDIIPAAQEEADTRWIIETREKGKSPVCVSRKQWAFFFFIQERIREHRMESK